MYVVTHHCGRALMYHASNMQREEMRGAEWRHCFRFLATPLKVEEGRGEN